MVNYMKTNPSKHDLLNSFLSIRMGAIVAFIFTFLFMIHIRFITFILMLASWIFLMCLGMKKLFEKLFKRS